LYAYFSHSLKRTKKFVSLDNIVETWGQWILRNIKTHWISMLLLVKKVMSEYCALALKMHQNAGNNIQTTHNLELFFYLEVMM
jgi:hypothetical protein